MKLKFFLLTFLLLQLNLHAQYFNMNIYETKYNNDSVIIKAKVAQSEIKTLIYNKKGHLSSRREIYHYTEKGTMSFYSHFSDTAYNARLTVHKSAILNPIGKPYFYNAGPRYYSIIHYAVFNDINQYNKVFNYKKSGKLNSINLYEYKDSLMTKNYYLNKNHKINQYFVYTYNNRKLKNISLYSNKNKLIRSWDYECDDVGTIHKSKDTTTYCTKKTYTNDGRIITSTVGFDYDGQTFKHVTIQDSNLYLLESMSYYGKEEILRYHQINTFINKKIATSYQWNGDSKGKATYSQFLRYNAMNQIIEDIDTSHKSKELNTYNSQYLYDNNGLLIEIKKYNKEHLYMFMKFSYSYYKKD